MSVENHNRQKMIEGFGPTYHRIYSVLLDSHIEAANTVMEELKKDMNQFSPQLLARFEKVSGAHHELKTSDEYQIHITGPWNGPVRVSEVFQNGFVLVTLKGHLEAGEIRLEIVQENDQQTYFRIESWARSRDQIVDFVYDKVPIAKLAQTEMWTSFCTTFAEKVVKVAQADQSKVHEVQVITERQDEETGQWQKN